MNPPQVSAPTGTRIIDGHAHIASTDFLPLSFIEGVVDNLIVSFEAQGITPNRDRIRKQALAQFCDGNCDQLIEQMDEAGICQTVLLLPDFTYALRDTKLTIAEMMERHVTVLERHPDRFFVFAGVDPRWGRDGVDLFTKAVREYNFHGLKLYPPCGYSPSDESLFPYFEICRDAKLPVLLHTGGTSPALQLEFTRPLMVEKAARLFPEVPFILAHASTCYRDECLMLCSSRPNIFLDVSGFESQPIERLNGLLSHGVNHKIIFGTDWPVFRGQGRQRHFLEMLLAEDGPTSHLREWELNRFFHGTIESLLPCSPSKQSVWESSH